MSRKDFPKISILIPVFNGTNYLGEAIDSALSQTYSNYEVIVIDDGSTDQTWQVIQSYGSHLRGIRKENGGVASALNRGIQEARGDYIAWLSHDDLFLPNKLERQIIFLQGNPQFQACYTDYYLIDARGNLTGEIQSPWYPRLQAIRVLFRRGYINGSTMVIKRTCFDRIGLFSAKWRYTQDTEMWLRLLEHFEIGRVPEKLGKLRFHPEQGSRNVESHIVEAQAMYREIFEKLLKSGIFTREAGFSNDPRGIAEAYNWLGNAMALGHGWYDFADNQYERSVTIYPVWNNPARWNRMMNQGRRVLKQARKKVAKQVRRITARILPAALNLI